MTETGLPCIEGEGSPDSKGYRTRIFTIGRMKQVRLAQHRLAWEQAWGLKIPAGLLIRHSCDNPSCVNPMHLMIGTARDNSLDAISRGRTASQRKTHCPQGHELIEGNLLPNSLKRGWRACRTCKIEVDRQARLRRKAAVS